MTWDGEGLFIYLTLSGQDTSLREVRTDPESGAFYSLEPHTEEAVP